MLGLLRLTAAGQTTRSHQATVAEPDKAEEEKEKHSGGDLDQK
jgi:hypothetical protein